MSNSILETISSIESREKSNLESSELIESSEPMLGSLLSPSSLLEAYEGNPLEGFASGIKYLAKKYPNMRRVKGDGNCFYRAFLFEYLEQLHSHYMKEEDETLKNSIQSELSRFSKVIANSKDALIAIGYEEFTFEYFYEALLELLQNLFTLSSEELISRFQEDGESDYYTWFMRLLTALSLRSNAEIYLPFIQDGNCVDIDSFCKQEVEPMGRECEQMQIIAIATYLDLQVNIEYLDGKRFDESTGLNVVSCGELSSNVTKIEKVWRNITLLYRPGHYDILYR